MLIILFQNSVSPDTTRPDDRKPPSEKDADDSMDFDIDDIDKQLEMALEKKRVGDRGDLFMPFLF